MNIHCLPLLLRRSWEGECWMHTWKVLRDEKENVRTGVEMKMEGKRPRGRPVLRWKDTVRRDLKARKIGKEWATDWSGLYKTRHVSEGGGGERRESLPLFQCWCPYLWNACLWLFRCNTSIYSSTTVGLSSPLFLLNHLSNALLLMPVGVPGTVVFHNGRVTLTKVGIIYYITL